MTGEERLQRLMERAKALQARIEEKARLVELLQAQFDAIEAQLLDGIAEVPAVGVVTERDEEDWSQVGGAAEEAGATIAALARLSALAEQDRLSAAMVEAQKHSPLGRS